MKIDINRIPPEGWVLEEAIAPLTMRCGRCLLDFKETLNKKLRFNYMADKLKPIIDLNLEIREELILDYPIKPLCRADCKGLCLRCGRNLNDGLCSCKD